MIGRGVGSVRISESRKAVQSILTPLMAPCMPTYTSSRDRLRAVETASNLPDFQSQGQQLVAQNNVMAVYA